MDPRRAIPSVDRLLASPAFAPLLERAPRRRVVELLQAVQRELRARPGREGEGEAALADEAEYARRVAERLGRLEQSSLVPVINATGVVLHTNLGRAPLADAALEAIAAVAGGYAALEYDLEAGRRGSRYDHCAGLLRELTGAEAALVVNNNAAALVLALGTLALGRDALVSRGELVEIGDSFRIAEIVQRSGAHLVEVGSTNRTHLADYAAALNGEHTGDDVLPDAGEAQQRAPAGTGAILKVNRSNFHVSGFTAETTIPQLATLARGRIPIVADLGSGLLLDAALLGLPAGEPTAMQALREGADVVTMSGDKLLGGPQAGIIVGRGPLVAAMRRNPLCRALRVDKLTLAALEATLRLYLQPERALQEIPTLRMLRLDPAEIGARARNLVSRLAAAGVAARLEEGNSAVGGGAYPQAPLPTVLVALAGAAQGGTGLAVRSASELERRLRLGAGAAVLARIADDRVLLDLRTVLPREEPRLLDAILAAHA
ncbi:MAG TPA: L-seryl-tRNA(Sec) selenium transferase [Longimicrobiales bacterium]